MFVMSCQVINSVSVVMTGISAFTMLLTRIGYENIYNEIAEEKWQVPWRKEKIDTKGKPVLDAEKKQM
ncbi:MAG: hypothetical protein LBG80_12220 [Bacteroidales bacterium]|nr:hypothetical protein [Bacteroidales bacterium]